MPGTHLRSAGSVGARWEVAPPLMMVSAARWEKRARAATREEASGGGQGGAPEPRGRGPRVPRAHRAGFWGEVGAAALTRRGCQVLGVALLQGAHSVQGRLGPAHQVVCGHREGEGVRPQHCAACSRAGRGAAEHLPGELVQRRCRGSSSLLTASCRTHSASAAAPRSTANCWSSSCCCSPCSCDSWGKRGELRGPA